MSNVKYTHVRVPKSVKEMYQVEKLFIALNVDKIPREVLYPSKCPKCGSIELKQIRVLHEGLIEILKCCKCGFKFPRITKELPKQKLQELIVSKMGMGLLAGFALNALFYLMKDHQ